MIDYYKVLGLAKGASKAAIRKAFRDKSKTTHPDAGGTIEIFNLVNQAHQTLSNDQKRAYYDQSGHDNPNDKPDTALALEILYQLFDCFINDENASLSVDVLSRLKTILSTRLDDLNNEASVVKAKIKKAEGLKQRITKKNKGDDLLKGLLSKRIKDLKTTVINIEATMPQFKEAIKIIDDYTFIPEGTEWLKERIENLNSCTNITYP